MENEKACVSPLLSLSRLTLFPKTENNKVKKNEYLALNSNEYLALNSDPNKK
jgi:hypothetical protein